MLKALRDALAEVKRGVIKILDLLSQYPDITRERLAREVGRMCYSAVTSRRQRITL